MIAERIPELEKLSREEKLLLASELWQANADIPEDAQRDEAIEKLLQERLLEYEENPDAVITWEEMKRKYGRE